MKFVIVAIVVGLIYRNWWLRRRNKFLTVCLWREHQMVKGYRRILNERAEETPGV